MFIHVGLVPILEITGEQKTKPLQHSIQELRRIGIQPDMIIARCRTRLIKESIGKIALYGNIPEDMVISSHNVEVIYEVPLILESQNVGDKILSRLGLQSRKTDLSELREYVEKWKKINKEVEIALIGKYTKLKDSYLSIIEALKHAGVSNNVKPRLKWIESTDIENGKVDIEEELSTVKGAVILPGFGRRGAEGKIRAIQYLRENSIPTLGICFGLQLMVVEYARNVVGLEGANSTELDPDTPYPVIDLMETQRGLDEYGGTMRLGAYKIMLEGDTLAHRLYGRKEIYERHRHRYEVNPKYIDKIFDQDFKIAGYSYDGRVEFVEVTQDTHPFYIATQAHPEFKSRYCSPSPLFKGLVEAALKLKIRI